MRPAEKNGRLTSVARCRSSNVARSFFPLVVSGISRTFAPGVPLYAGATLVTLSSPTAAVILFAAIAVFYVLESSLFGKGA